MDVKTNQQGICRLFLMAVLFVAGSHFAFTRRSPVYTQPCGWRILGLFRGKLSCVFLEFRTRSF